MTKTIKPSLIAICLLLTILLPILINTTYNNINSYINIKDNYNINSQYTINIIANMLLFLLIIVLLTIRLNIKINKDYIEYRLSPWYKKPRIINKNDIEYISIEGKYFHIGIGLKGTIDYAIGNGNCIKIHTVYGRKYLLSTGLQKDELMQVLKEYGYCK